VLHAGRHPAGDPPSPERGVLVAFGIRGQWIYSHPDAELVIIRMASEARRSIPTARCDSGAICVKFTQPSRPLAWKNLFDPARERE
jgi:hypothetical protein